MSENNGRRWAWSCGCATIAVMGLGLASVAAVTVAFSKTSRGGPDSVPVFLPLPPASLTASLVGLWLVATALFIVLGRRGMDAKRRKALVRGILAFPALYMVAGIVGHVGVAWRESKLRREAEHVPGALEGFPKRFVRHGRAPVEKNVADAYAQLCPPRSDVWAFGTGRSAGQDPLAPLDAQTKSDLAANEPLLEKLRAALDASACRWPFELVSDQDRERWCGNSPLGAYASLLVCDGHAHAQQRDVAGAVERYLDGARIGADLALFGYSTSAMATLEPTGHLDQLQGIAFAPAGDRIATASLDGTAGLWDVASGRLERLVGKVEGVFAVAFAPDGKTLAVASSKGVTLYDPATGARRSIVAPRAVAHAVAFSPDGSLLAVGTSKLGSVLLVDMASGEVVRELAVKGDVRAVAFSPDGKTVAAGTAASPRLWDRASGNALAALLGDRKPVLSVAFSPDGKTLATGSEQAAVRLWDVPSGQLRATLEGHTSSVTAVAFSPDGKTLATAGADAIRFWDPDAAKLRAKLAKQASTRNGIAFAPDGKTLVSAQTDGTVLVWRSP